MPASRPDLRTANWRKSSYSNGDGGNCLEVGQHFPGAARWRKSSYCNGDGGECVEVAIEGTGGGIVPVRDTKTAPTGQVITFPATQWARFIGALHSGDVGGA
ncbi:DUF397 domain-containing protein [Streptomyces smyrnaeus]|uniref:DUF397 domain-containing protein n=1 Tax=Streptomyces smyrnaeus TaxID=1387713 RepID=A0ABS3XXL1_9ACTN|nr:DUF397 domain-containing protein [Streptomyces smyrnaeus]MBO8200148.1 DUF397 domain-containing protein [Streptomyces smyrnaeus]